MDTDASSWRRCVRLLQSRRRHRACFDVLLLALVGLAIWGLGEAASSLPPVNERVHYRRSRTSRAHGHAAARASNNQTESHRSEMARRSRERLHRVDQGACVDLAGSKQPRLEVQRQVARATAVQPASAAATSAAFIRGCDSALWHEADARAYFQSNWHPGAPTGVSCADLRRVGRTFDGGKMVCFPLELAACRVVSVGSNMEMSFERELLAHAPDCEVDIYDGTLTTTQAAETQRELDVLAPRGNARFFHHMFSNTTWQQYANAPGGLTLLKMDCDGCEWDALPAFVDNVCTAQLVVEVHGCMGEASIDEMFEMYSPPEDDGSTPTVVVDQLLTAPTSQAIAVNKTHTLMKRLERSGFRIFYAEPNVQNSDGTCVEYSLVRNATAGHSANACEKARDGPPRNYPELMSWPRS